MSNDERNRVLDLFHTLRHTGSEEAWLRFGSQHGMEQARAYRVPYSAMLGLQQYARCRAWARYFRRLGKLGHARREAALAGQQTRYFRSL